MKTCTKCGLEKELKEFYKDKRCAGGHVHWCKPCQNEQSNKYYHANIEKRRAQARASRKKRRSEDLGVEFSNKFLQYSKGKKRIHATPDELVKLYNDDPNCLYCRIPLEAADASIDHVIPVSRGGALTIDNLRICCADCNRLKYTRTAEEFFEFLLRYSARINGILSPISE